MTQLRCLHALLLSVFLCLPARAADLNALKAELAKGGPCLTTLPLAREIHRLDKNDLTALHTIADCSSAQIDTHSYAAGAKEVFEQSRVLSIVPKVLELAQIKDLIPVMREVEVKKDKSVADYLMLSEIYDRMGEPEKQIQTLREAVQLNSNDPRPLLLLASKQMDSGNREEAQELFQRYLQRTEQHAGRAYLMAYVAAMAFPLVFSLVMIALIWAGSYALYRRRADFIGSTDFRAAFPLFAAFMPTLLALRFYQTGSAIPFGALLLFFFVLLFFLAKPVLSKVYVPVWNFIRDVIVGPIAGIGYAKVLNRFSATTRVLIAFFTLFILMTVVPTIVIPDLRYGLILFCGLAFYSTLGSLMATFLRSRTSLRSSLRWIAAAATVPFLISYVISNWSTLAEPLLYGRLPTERAIQSAMNYLIFWGVSVFLSLHLGKIIASALTEPLLEIMFKVSKIEKGDFKAKVQVLSRDEIGHLSEAINRMAEGLEKREKIERTFSKYVDKKVAERILNGVEDEVRIAGQSVEAVVMFADIRGFTTMAEKTSAQDVVRILNRFFERMVRIIQDHGGVIDKFIGDNLMAVWGVPYAVENAHDKALRAALAMRDAMRDFNGELRSQNLPEVQIGIGINAGKVIAGSIGSAERMEYTVIGDVVNTAQRAEANAKPGQILVTDDTYKLVQAWAQATALPPIKVKGKEIEQKFWSVDGDLSMAARTS